MDHLGHDHEHTHTHDHEHTHEHTHDHPHVHPDMPAEKVAALLQYMLDHNIHHAGELSDMAGQLTGEARHQLLHAVESFDQANGYLSAALEELKKQ